MEGLLDLVPICSRAMASRWSAGKGRKSMVSKGTTNSGVITCINAPSTDSRVVRRISCRSTIVCKLWCNGDRCSKPVSRNTKGITYREVPGSSCSINHNRCWANEAGRIKTSASVCACSNLSKTIRPYPDLTSLLCTRKADSEVTLQGRSCPDSMYLFVSIAREIFVFCKPP